MLKGGHFGNNIKANQGSQSMDDYSSSKGPSTKHLSHPIDNKEVRTPRRPKSQDRPSTPSVYKTVEKSIVQPMQQWATADFEEWNGPFADMPTDKPTTSKMNIDVKPLPKLRLDLMPAPREEDEDNISTM